MVEDILVGGGAAILVTIISCVWYLARLIAKIETRVAIIEVLLRRELPKEEI